MANILAGTLIELCDLLTARVAPGGTIIMSGVWGEDQVAKVLTAYKAHGGFGTFSVEYAEAGWALLQATRLEEGSGAQSTPAALVESDLPQPILSDVMRSRRSW